MKRKYILEKTYNPRPVEKYWSKFWIEKRVFVARVPSSEKIFSMVLPPPMLQALFIWDMHFASLSLILLFAGGGCRAIIPFGFLGQTMRASLSTM